MAHTSLSTVLTKLDSTPLTKSATLARDGHIRSAIGLVTIAATTVGQTLAFVRIPVRARIVSIHPTMTTSMVSGAMSIGIYRPDTSTIKEIDKVCLSAGFALAVTVSGTSALTAPTPTQLTQSIADAFSTAIGTASATADSMVDIVGVISTVSTGAATAMAVEVKYVLPE